MSVEPEFIRLQHAFTRHLRDPDAVPPPPGLPEARLAVYSNAVYHNVEGFMRDNFPRVRDVLADAHWQALIRDYLIRHRAQTPLFVELLDEFLHYLTNERDCRQDPPFLNELAHFDWLENAIMTDERRLETIAVEPAGDLLTQPLIINPVHQLISYDYPVHAINASFKPAAAPGRLTRLLVFRDCSGAFGVLDLNDVAARLFVGLNAPEAPLAASLLADIAIELGHPDPTVVTRGGLALLERWLEREVILGFAPGA